MPGGEVSIPGNAPAPKVDPRVKALQEEGVSQKNIEALLSGKKPVEQVVDDQMALARPSFTAKGGDDVKSHAKALEEGKEQAKNRIREILHGAETISASAIRIKATGRVFEGAIHYAAAQKAIDLGLLPEEGIAPLIENGFVTNTGRFVDRKKRLKSQRRIKRE